MSNSRNIEVQYNDQPEDIEVRTSGLKRFAAGVAIAGSVAGFGLAANHGINKTMENTDLQNQQRLEQEEQGRIDQIEQTGQWIPPKE